MSEQFSASNPKGVILADWPWGFRVPSATIEGKTYYVDFRTGTCDCPAGQCKKPCWHKRAVNEYAMATWKQIIHRMTGTPAGWALLREIEGFVKKGK